MINSLDNYTSNETPEEIISRITSNNHKLAGTLDVVLEYINQLYFGIKNKIKRNTI